MRAWLNFQGVTLNKTDFDCCLPVGVMSRGWMGDRGDTALYLPTLVSQLCVLKNVGILVTQAPILFIYH